MRILRTAAASLALFLPMASCSTGDAIVFFDGELYVVSCSLGCTNGAGGDQVFCSIVNTYQNQELVVRFSEPIDLFSVNTSSFRVINVANGTSPSGQFFLDPLNPRRLIFRPSLTFDESGNPIFGFAENTTYQITIPGTAQGDNPPFVSSVAGNANTSRLQCTVLTSQGIIDPVPGAPKVEMFVDVVTSYDANGDPDGFAFDVPVTKDPELSNVFRSTEIDFVFNDIMNVATLVNPSTGQAPFILVEIDDDGTLATLTDRVPHDGSFVFTVDQEQLKTRLTFTADLPFPSAGPDAPLSPRRIAVTIPTTVQDLVSNPVLPQNGGGTTGLVPEESQFTETVLPPGGEDFADTTNEDSRRSGGFWGGGRLTPGLTGGAGQLGDLVVPTGTAVVLNTESQTFPLGLADGVPVPFTPDILGNPDPAGGGDPGLVDHPDDFPTTVTITDGGFTFSVLDVLSGGSLRVEGINPARLWSRGDSNIQAGGEIDIVGVTPAPIDSMTVLKPEVEIPLAVNAANGADGGYGADRFDMTVNGPMMGLGDPENDAISNPGADPDGRDGMGVGRINNNNGGGVGGLHFPDRYPTVNFETDPANNNNHGVTFNVSVVGDFGQNDSQCRALIVGQSGSGGAYATDGGVGHSESTQPTANFPDGAPNTPTDTPGGDSGEVGLAPPDENNTGYILRKLEWHLGNLRGGSAGGGGGNHPFGAWATGYDGLSENDCIGPVAESRFRAWHDHTGAQGGYGGGALHYVSGKRIVIDGVIDARGGNGGAPRGEVPPLPPQFHDFGQYAMPGGGGSGGAVKLRSLVVEIADVPGRIDLRGGLGGAGFAGATKGGDGGVGLLRVEDQAAIITRAAIADDVAPVGPNDSLEWISVAPGELASVPRQRPDSMSASSSCWLAPVGNFFGLGFIEDQADEDTGDPALMGWNMEVIWDDGGGEENIPFRGANNMFMGSFENEFGQLLGYDLGVGETAAPLVVRFQGARASGNFDPCDLDLNDPNIGIVPGSVTPWVDDPTILNEFSPVPNMVRFTIIFDGTVDAPNNDTPGLILPNIKGVTNLSIRVLPD